MRTMFGQTQQFLWYITVKTLQTYLNLVFLDMIPGHIITVDHLIKQVVKQSKDLRFPGNFSAL